MQSFIDALNTTSVVFVVDLAAYGWVTPLVSGYEAINVHGEIRAFGTYKQAHQWRLSSIIESKELGQ